MDDVNASASRVNSRRVNSAFTDPSCQKHAREPSLSGGTPTRVPLVPREQATASGGAKHTGQTVDRPIFLGTIKPADRGASWCHFPRPLPAAILRAVRFRLAGDGSRMDGSDVAGHVRPRRRCTPVTGNEERCTARYVPGPRSRFRSW